MLLSLLLLFVLRDTHILDVLDRCSPKEDETCPEIDLIKDRKTQPFTAICALFPVLLADSLHVESALSLTKYCFRLERHIFRARGAHPRFSGLFMFPLFICTLFIWGN